MLHAIDLTVHLANFRNFDLMLAGAYYIKVGCHYTLANKSREDAMPYLLVTGDRSCNANDFFELSNGYLDFTSRKYVSSSFFVDYSDVFKELNQICVFRLYCYDAHPRDVTLTFELNHLDTGKDQAKQGKLASAALKVRDAELGFHEYCTVIFNGYHFNYLEAFVHSRYASSL
jgi:hypothetical protein